VATAYAPIRKRLEAVVDRRFKYEHLEFGAYRDEVVKILGVLEPKRAAEKLVHEAVRELQATGGAVVDADDAPVATAGTWPVAAVVRMPIAGHGPLRAILLGPRIDGRLHDPLTLARLEDVAELVVSAVDLARPSGPGTPG
jgi:transposase